MSQSKTPSPPQFRPPASITNSTGSQAPSAIPTDVQNLLQGEWYMIQSSNSFWTDKRNVKVHYASPRNEGGVFDDSSSYQALGADAVKSMDGKDTPFKDDSAAFTWQGKGLMRIASAKWEVLSFTARPDGDWMLTYVHKSMFTSAAVNLMCRKKGGVTEPDLVYIMEWLRKVEDDGFQKAVDGIVDILQE